jgi:succinate dehydrogenase/fumarate reductase flavoprotein subunit
MAGKGKPAKWDIETDVVVVGSGAAGLTAAIVAHDRGAKVVLLEKSSLFGGATAFSGAGMWCPNNKFLRAGYEVDVWDPKNKTWVKRRIDGNVGREMAIKYMKRLSMGMVSDEMIETYVDTVWRALDYLEEHTRLKISHVRLMPEYYPEWSEFGAVRSGRTVEPAPYDFKQMPEELRDKIRVHPAYAPFTIDELDHWGGQAATDAMDLEMLGKRMVEGIHTMGVAFVGALVHSCYDRGIDMRLNTTAKDLVVENGRVVGVIAEHEGKELKIHAKKGVVLAAGGFEWDEYMVKHFLRGPMLGPVSPPHNTGDGHRMGMKVGAKLSQMQEAWWFPATAHFPGDTYDGKVSYRTVLYEKAFPGTIVVNKYGKRFVNECANYRSVHRAWFTYNPSKHEFTNIPSFLIFDQACHRRYTIAMVAPFDEFPDPPVKKGNTIRELAEKAGIDPEGLEETVKKFNQYAREGKDPEFHRGESWYDQFYGDLRYKEHGVPHPNLAPIEKPPFYAIEYTVGCLGTCGGLLINTKAQVLDWNDKPIPGLYAAGNNTGTCMGMGYPGGGSTVGPAVCFGYIAGKEIVKEPKA